MARQGFELPSGEVTPRSLYFGRRAFLATGALGAGAVLLAGRSAGAAAGKPPGKLAPLTGLKDSPLSTTDEKLTKYEEVTTYNNFYEFGTDKADPARNASTLKPRPWTVKLDGELKKPRTVDLDALIKQFPLEERVYRMRCVEAWSMVIPWVGFPLGDLIKSLEPTSKAKFVAFETLRDPEQMPGQRHQVLDWPYVEALRIDEAMNPLAILAVGLYGEVLPNQNGAPLRLVVPWKYGFKGIKSIVRISLVEKQPATTWNISGPSEYGFYANVNPEVDHPRWSQARERRIGELFRRKTLPFNGYGDQVASLYSGLDLKANY